MKIKFPYLYEHQEVVFNAIKEDNGRGRSYVVKAKRQVGKSILAITALLFFAFQFNDSIGVCVEPTLPQGRRLYKQLLKAVGGDVSPLVKSANATLLEIEFTNGSQIVFKSGEQGEALRGITVKNSILILDEAAYLPDDVIDILLPTVDANKCPILYVSSPMFESGRFYERYIEGLKDDTYVKSFDWSQYDLSAFLTPEKLEYYRQTLPPLKFRSEYLGEFITDKSFVFGDFTACYGPATKPPVYAGLDWATGKQDKDDYTSLVLMDEDGAVVDIKFWKVYDPMALADNISEILNVTPTLRTVQLEENSIGEVYLSALKRKVKNKSILKPFITTNDSKRRIVEQLISAFGNKTVTIPEDSRLIRQLQGYQIEKLPSGKYTYNAMSGFNDDAVIALSLAYDLTVKPATKPRFGFA